MPSSGINGRTVELRDVVDGHSGSHFASISALECLSLHEPWLEQTSNVLDYLDYWRLFIEMAALLNGIAESLLIR